LTVLRFARPLTLSGELFRATRLRRCRLAECHAACCLHGVWLDPLEKDDILRHAGRIIPHMPGDRRDPAGWFGAEREPDPFYPSGYVVPAAVVPNPAHYGGTECVFLRPDWLCSLQTASAAAGFHPWRWKPFHCIIHPITIESGIFTLAPDEELRTEPGSCFREGSADTKMSDSLAEEIGFLRTVGRDGQPEQPPSA
jgi:hypothetical protein